jgi:cytochrome P450
MARIVGLVRRGVDFSLEMRGRFGDVYRSVVGSQPIVYVWDADEAHKILRNEDNAWSTALGWSSTFLKGFNSSGNMGFLLTLDFDDHRLARKLVQPAFTMKALQGYLGIADRGFERALPRWVERRHVDFKSEIRTLLAGVAGEIFTGIDDPAKIAVLDRALSDFWNGTMALSKKPWLSPKFRRGLRGLETLRTTFLDLVPERRKRDGDDLFSQMCRVENDTGLTDEALVRVFITVMFGAFDTTAAAMTSMAYLLAKHPEWQERLRDEARRIDAKQLDVSSMREMKEHEWVWKETLRLLPVTGMVPRCALREVELGGHKLPAGTVAAVVLSGLGRHPAWWTNPARFDPERFSPERGEDKQHPVIYSPFGMGAHACIGMQLANFEMKLFWHKLLTRSRFSLVKDYEARHTHTPMGCVSGKVSLRLEPLRS